MKNLSGKVIVIAGGSGGIGSALYKKLLLYDANVTGISRTENIQLKDFAECNNKKYEWITSNLTSKSAWEESLNKIADRFGKIDVLINCSGLLIPGKVENLTCQQIEKIISTNFTSFVFASKAAIPGMKEQGFGHIINLGSLGGIIPMPYESVYCASKFALRGFTLSLKKELAATAVNVSLISPGPVQTEMLVKESSDTNSTMAFVIRPLHPDFVAEKIIHTILHPKSELVLHKSLKTVSLLVNLFPRLFNFIFPILNFIGKRNRNRFIHRTVLKKDNIYAN
jgi:short-subunit dehydrogenase